MARFYRDWHIIGKMPLQTDAFASQDLFAILAVARASVVLHNPALFPSAHARLSMVRFVVAVFLPVVLLACSPDSQVKKSSQVIAKVNKSEISIHQLNNLLKQAGSGLTEDQQKLARRQLLERLVDQELLVQQATLKKLDRDPNVLQAIEAARRQILSQAVMEQLGATTSRPTEEEVKKFYVDHPELFDNRRIYRLVEIAVLASNEQMKQVAEEAEKAKSVNELLSYLKSQNIRFNAQSTVKAAEQLPLHALPRLNKLKEGQFAAIPASPGLIIFQVLGTQVAPLKDKEAFARIEQFLFNQNKTAAAQSELKRLREIAKIEYVGEFQKAQKDEKDAEPPAGSERSSKDFMDKGVSGLR